MKITKSHLNKESWGNNGVCYTSRDTKTNIDTIIIHSTYLSSEMLTPKYPEHEVNIQNELNKLFTFLNEEELTKKQWDATMKKVDNLLGIACKDKFIEGNVKDSFSAKGIKAIFEYVGVSAHYLVGRGGEVIEIVDPKYKALHAGKSKLPNSDKVNVNEFSIGIEILCSEDEKILDIQYESLKNLVIKLNEDYPISNIYGHSDIAIPKGRKIDPIGFDWKLFLKLLSPNLKTPFNHPSI